MKHRITLCDSPASFKIRKLDAGLEHVFHKSTCVSSLLDLSAKIVAAHLPFEYVERMIVHVPEPVQEKIIFYSFPQRDCDIYTYASFHSKNDKSRDKIPYYQGVEIFKNDCVRDVTQIGFHLTGSIRQESCSTESDSNKFKVSITFDRCKIISVCCDCGSKGLSWCPHVVALALFRIRQPHLVDYRSPISDALVRMDRGQLQKFAQYLIASHPNKILPNAQQLADQLLQPESNINKTSGAPDPTAGGSLEAVAAWYLDEQGVREQLRVELANLASHGPMASNLIASDSNASGSNTVASPLPNEPLRRSTSNVNTRRSQSGAGDVDGGLHMNGSCTSGDCSTCTTNNNGANPNHSNLEVGLDWLVRYRHLTHNQNPFIGPSSTTNYDACLDSSSAFDNDTNPQSHQAGCLNSFQQSNLSSSHHSHHHSSSCLLSLCNNFGRNSSSALSTTVAAAAGTFIAAMFAKVRELMAKRDSNGPRLLSLITEELLTCAKLPLIKSRRSQRSSNLNLHSRLQSAGRTLPFNYGQGYNSDSSTSTGYLSSLFSSTLHPFYQPPLWTIRLWDEVCLLWTCVVLSPDCTTEVKRQWRSRFIQWSRVNRCPRDESYLVPDHYFASLACDSHRDSEDDATNQEHQALRSNHRRPSVFRLPIEATFMTWNHVFYANLLSASQSPILAKMDKSHHLNDDDVDTNLRCVFRRPSSHALPKRRSTLPYTPASPSPSSPINVSIPHHSSSSSAAAVPNVCSCPYCDHDNLDVSNEPFPLLCLRVQALRSNGYLSQALHLAVYISQHLIRNVKHKFQIGTHLTGGIEANVENGDFASKSGGGAAAAAPNMTSNSTEGRRSFVSNLIHGQHRVHSIARGYVSSASAASSPMFANHKFPSVYRYNHHYHGAYPPRLSSPQTSALSPPVPINFNRLGLRRLGLSPSASSPSPSPTSVPRPPSSPCSNGFRFGCSPPAGYNVAYPPLSPLAFNKFGSQSSTTLPNHRLLNSPNSRNVGFTSPPPPIASPPSSSTSNYPATSSSPSSSSTPSSSAAAAPSSSSNPQTADAASFECPSHGDTGWIGLAGRPLICLVECLLDAAAVVVELSSHEACQNQSKTFVPAVSLWGQMEKASFYLYLAIKVSVLALFQQRRLIGSSVSRLIACQHQETRLLALLDTVPKDVNSAMAMCEVLCFLLGPPLGKRHSLEQTSSPLSVSSSSSSSSSWWWWWSALGPVVHLDSFPVHGVAQFCLDYLVETQRLQSQFESYVTANGFSIRIRDLLFTLVTRAMRFSIHETAFDNNGCLTSFSSPPHMVDSNNELSNSSNSPFTRSNSSPSLFHSNSHIGGTSNYSQSVFTARPFMYANRTPNGRPYFHPYQQHYSRNRRPTSTSVLAVNTEVGDHDPMMLSTTSQPSSSLSSFGPMFDSVPSYVAGAPQFMLGKLLLSPLPPPPPPPPPYPHLHIPPPIGPPPFHCNMLTDQLISYPSPLPSLLANSTLTCLKSNGVHYSSSTLLCNSPWFHPSQLSFTPHRPSQRSSHDDNAAAAPVADDDDRLFGPNHQSLSNAPVRRCLDVFQMRQTRLAISLIKLSKSHLGRLDQIAHLCTQYIWSPVNLFAISQQIFMETVKWESPHSLLFNRKQCPNMHLFYPSDLMSNISNYYLSSLNSSSATSSSINTTDNLMDTSNAYHLPTCKDHSSSTQPLCCCHCCHHCSNGDANFSSKHHHHQQSNDHATNRNRINLISTAFYLALDVTMRTLPLARGTHSIHWRRREMLSWTISLALHLGPAACLFVLNHWFAYMTAREAIHCLAPPMLMAAGTLDSNQMACLQLFASQHQPDKPAGLADPNAIHSNHCCMNLHHHHLHHHHHRHHHHSLLNLFDLSNWPMSSEIAPTSNSSSNMFDVDSVWRTLSSSASSSTVLNPTWFGFCPNTFQDLLNSIMTIIQLVGTIVPYTKAACDQITSAVRHMAMQAASRDPVNCALTALNLCEPDATAFDAIYRLVLHSAEQGNLGPVQLYALARYMDRRGWTWRAFPFALHATRLFVLTPTSQDIHPASNDVIWACLLGLRLGPGALQEILNFVIRNIQCPNLLTDILHRLRNLPCGGSVLPPPPPPTPSNPHPYHPHHCPYTHSNNNNNNASCTNGSNETQPGINPMTNTGSANSAPNRRSNGANAISSSSNNNTNSVSNRLSPHSHTTSYLPKMMLSLDKAPLKGLLDAAINSYVVAIHTRLTNISPRQYSEFVDFLGKARDTFYLSQSPDGPVQFQSLVECLRQTYRGKRKLVSLLADRFG